MKSRRKPETPVLPETPIPQAHRQRASKPVPQTGDDYNLYLYIGGNGNRADRQRYCLFLCIRNKKGGKSIPKGVKAATGVLLICAALTVGSGFLLADEISEYKESADTYADLSKHLTVPDREETPEENQRSFFEISFC